MTQIAMKYDGCMGRRIIPAFDPVNGNQAQINTYELWVRNIEGKLIKRQEAFNFLSQPNWNGKPFYDLLPTLTPDIGVPHLMISNWKEYDFHDPAKRPLEDEIYSLRRKSGLSWIHFQDSTLSWEQMGVWHSFGVDQYKRADDAEYYSIDNPDYINNELIRTAEKNLYKQLLYDNMVMMGDAVFPSLYDNTYPVNVEAKLLANTKLQTELGVTWTNGNDIRATEIAKNRLLFVHWFELQNGIYIEVPVEDGKWRGNRKMVPLLSSSNIDHIMWNTFMTLHIGITDKIVQLKHLLGML
jgi:hypothetical protein